MQVDFQGREAQFNLFQTILASAAGDAPFMYINAGGAIRGGKSMTISTALLALCKIYPESKWSVHRKDMTILEATTVETINKIIGRSKNWEWSKRPGNYKLTYKPTESRLIFVGANESRDKDFSDTLGLEINGAFFDQLEEVSFEYYNAVCQRIGSWHIPKEPKPLCLTTYNPHPGWVKREKYLPYAENRMRSDEIYFPLSPYNEPSNTDAQWKVWASMPPDVRARMIEGDWNTFENKNPFFYAFKDEFKQPCERNMAAPLYLSFDFNINPATCSVWQFAMGKYIHCLKAYKVANCSIDELCQRIRGDYPGALLKITGDPAGKARNQGFARANDTMYTMIRKALNVSEMQIDSPQINYAGENYWREMRVLINSIFQNHPNIKIHPIDAADLLSDINLATTEKDTDKLYKTSGNTEYGMHLVDTMIYFYLTYFTEFTKFLPKK